MNKKIFTFDDHDLEEQSIPQSLIDKFESYQQDQIEDINTDLIQSKSVPLTKKSQLKQPKQRQETLQQPVKEVVKQKTKPKTKVKKKVKRKTKNKIKKKRVRQKRKRSWFSTLFLFLLSLLIIAGVCVGGYIAYDYYMKQQDQINKLENQLQDQQGQPEDNQQTKPQEPTTDPEDQQPTVPEENEQETQPDNTLPTE